MAAFKAKDSGFYGLVHGIGPYVLEGDDDIRCAVENDRKHIDLCVGAMGYKTTMTNKELASNHQEHQMEGSMHVRRMEDGYMHRRMQKNKHM